MGKDLKGKDLGKGFKQRTDGRYEARATINGVTIDIYNKSLTQLKKDFEEAKAKLLREEKNIRPNVTFKEWFDEWFERYKSPNLKSEISRKTYYRKIKNTYYAILGDKKMELISQLNIQDATNELTEKGYKDRSIKEALGIMRECLDIAVVNHIINTNPCISIKIKDNNEAASERRVLAKWEQKLFLDEVKNDYYNEAYQILLLTGMRIGEFSGLQWRDIDFEEKVIRINRSLSSGYVNGKKIEELTTPKTSNSYREIPFFGETEKLFISWRSKQAIYKNKLGDRWRANPEFGDLVFTSTMGSPVTRYVIVHDIKRVETNMILKEASRASREGRIPREIKHIHPHAFRHTFATRCFEKGMNPLVVQSIMGHANYETTLSYTHILDNRLQEEANKIGNFFDDDTPNQKN